MLSPTSSLLIWASDKIKTGQLLLSDAADPLAFSSSDKVDRLRIYCLQQVALYTTENLSWHSLLCPCFRVLSKRFSGNVLSHWAVCLSLTPACAIPCRKSSPEEGAGSFSRVLVTNASSDGIFFVGCTMLFIKDWPQPLGISPTKIWTLQCLYKVKASFLPSQGFLVQGWFVYTVL